MTSLVHIRRHAFRRPMGLLRHLMLIPALHRQRARLAQLDDHLLRDIGLSRAEALDEASRPAWDAPDHWHD